MSAARSSIRLPSPLRTLEIVMSRFTCLVLFLATLTACGDLVDVPDAALADEDAPETCATEELPPSCSPSR